MSDDVPVLTASHSKHRPFLIRLSLAWLGYVAIALGQQPAGALGSWEEGVALLQRHACAQCHEASPAQQRVLGERKGPDLTGVGQRVFPAYLRRFLLDPSSVHPGSAMPHMLARVDPADRESIAEDLVHFLVSQGGPMSSGTMGIPNPALEAGRQGFHHVGCVGCHAPEEAPFELEYALDEVNQISGSEREFHDLRVDPLVLPGTLPPPAMPLPDLAGKTTVSALAQFLKDPASVRPRSAMPSVGLTDQESLEIAAYLLRDQRRLGKGPTPGLEYELFRYENRGDDPQLPLHRLPNATGVVDTIRLPEHPESHFGVRIFGTLMVPQSGIWKFWTRSDDGSRLWIDDQLIVTNDGRRPAQDRSGEVRLEAGPHRIEVRFFEAEGEESLTASWAGPGQPRSEIPASALSHQGYQQQFPLGPPEKEFRLDPARVMAGKEWAQKLQCARCHDGVPAALDGASPSLTLTDVAARGVMCGEPSTGPDRGGVSYSFTEDQQRHLRAGLQRLAHPQFDPSPGDVVSATLRSQGCLGCHRRDGVGGVHPLRQAYFRLTEEVDVDDTGRIPPDLSGTERKLTAQALAGVLLEGQRVHQHMRTRMPQFDPSAMGRLLAAWRDLAPASASEEDEPESTADAVEAGRQLAGIDGGVGCVRCHGFGGRPSLGTPSVDLMTMSARLRWPWFRDLLADPGSVNIGTRMPEFWQNGKSTSTILGGDGDAQIRALWSFLRLGPTMPMPPGFQVKKGTYELIPDDRAIGVAVFMKGVSPRTLLLGHRERVHVAYDLESLRYVQAWRGDFFDAEGTWHGRAGRLEEIASADGIRFPVGPTVAVGEERPDPWPGTADREKGYRSLGRLEDSEGRMTFRSEVAGWLVEERAIPALMGQALGLRRELRLAGSSTRLPAWIQLWSGPVEPRGAGVYEAQGERPVRFQLETPADAEVRSDPRGLWVRIPADTAEARVAMELGW